jgi:IS1 family transposase
MLSQRLVLSREAQKVIPRKRHRAVGKESGQTNPVEQLDNTFRQRISRLDRETIFF